MIMIIIKSIESIVPCAIGWIGCEIYHRWIDRWIGGSDSE